MLDFCLPLPPLKRRCHGRKFKKQVAKLNSAAAAAVPGDSRSLSADLTGFLSVGFASFLSASLASSSSAGLAGFSEPVATASSPSENSVKNCVEFRNFG